MTTRPVQISFRNMTPSPAIEEEIRSRAAWLESFCPGIVRCRVVVEVPHRHRRHGRPHHVRIDVSLPGQHVIVNHEPAVDPASQAASRKRDELDADHKVAHVAIHEAFDVARRRIEDVARLQREQTRSHVAAT